MRPQAVSTLLASAVVAAFLAAPASSASSAVGLGAAETFAILAGSGITNTGASTVTGDVGSFPTTSQTGFDGPADSVTLTAGSTNHHGDAVTQAAKDALTTAYNAAASQTPATIATELGGQTVVAGVYRAASGTFGMTGTLTLDGENDAGAVFIFQTDSTLVTASAASIVLARGDQACNVFWKVGSAATLGSGSTFMGTILAHDDISLGDSVTVFGRLLAGAQPSGAGAVTLIHDTITRTPCSTGSGTSSSSSPSPGSTSGSGSGTSSGSSSGSGSGTGSGTGSATGPGTNSGTGSTTGPGTTTIPFFPTATAVVLALVGAAGGAYILLRKRR